MSIDEYVTIFDILLRKNVILKTWSTTKESDQEGQRED